MQEQKVYVVYEDGEPFGNNNKKVAYLKEGYAKQLVTNTVNQQYEQSIWNNTDKRWKFKHMTIKEKLELTKELRKHFEIRVFSDSGERI